MKKTLGLVGARGYVGRELSALVERHGDLDVRLAVSQRDGQSAADVAATKLDVYVLALPNGTSEPYVEAIAKARPDAVIVDLSADHRFPREQDARDGGWVYGQPERNRAALGGARRIANPGCYATAAQLSLAPLVPLLEGPANVFGVSGYSGAGTTPSPRNYPEALR
jgi:N-acetyl-gamma-glutamylphosphate reductase